MTPYVTSELDAAYEMIFAGASNNMTNVGRFEILHSDSPVSFVGVQATGQTSGNLFQSTTDDARYWVSLENLRMNSDGSDFYHTKGTRRIHTIHFLYLSMPRSSWYLYGQSI